MYCSSSTWTLLPAITLGAPQCSAQRSSTAPPASSSCWRPPQSTWRTGTRKGARLCLSPWQISASQPCGCCYRQAQTLRARTTTGTLPCTGHVPLLTHHWWTCCSMLEPTQPSLMRTGSTHCITASRWWLRWCACVLVCLCACVLVCLCACGCLSLPLYSVALVFHCVHVVVRVSVTLVLTQHPSPSPV